MSQFALQLAHPEPSRARLATLELQLACRERELAAFTRDLQALQARYLRELGGLHAQLVRLEQAVSEAEVRAGIRPPQEVVVETGPEGAAGEGDAADARLCANGATPSDDLKRMFREIARTVHPDRAADDAARFRRHSIMAEANRAYAERDADRLRLIMRSWRRGSGGVLTGDDDPQQVRRRTAHAVERLAEIDIEWADLAGSAIAGLKRKIDRTSAQGWDLFAEMVMQVKHEIARRTARLIALDGRK